MSRITDVISTDHRELQAYYDRLVDNDDPDEQTRFQNQLTWGLARHIVGEELVLFPALDRYLGPGEATQDRRQNQIVSWTCILLHVY
jgi:hemerythrin-like domain-containing protein